MFWGRKVWADGCHLNRFNVEYQLNYHVLYGHEGGKKHTCPECNKCFTYKSIKRHMDTVHLKLKNYKCDQCEVAYGQSGDLKRHKIRVHQNVTK